MWKQPSTRSDEWFSSSALIKALSKSITTTIAQETSFVCLQRTGDAKLLILMARNCNWRAHMTTRASTSRKHLFRFKSSPQPQNHQIQSRGGGVVVGGAATWHQTLETLSMLKTHTRLQFLCHKHTWKEQVQLSSSFARLLLSLPSCFHDQWNPLSGRWSVFLIKNNTRGSPKTNQLINKALHKEDTDSGEHKINNYRLFHTPGGLQIHSLEQSTERPPPKKKKQKMFYCLKCCNTTNTWSVQRTP